MFLPFDVLIIFVLILGAFAFSGLHHNNAWVNLSFLNFCGCSKYCIICRSECFESYWNIILQQRFLRLATCVFYQKCVHVVPKTQEILSRPVHVLSWALQHRLKATSRTSWVGYRLVSKVKLTTMLTHFSCFKYKK